MHSLDELKTSMRASKVQWRRVFRKDANSIKGCIAANNLVESFRKLGLDLSEIAITELSERFAIPDEKAAKVIEVLNQKMGKAANISSACSMNSICIYSCNFVVFCERGEKCKQARCAKGTRIDCPLNRYGQGVQS